jgi:hypothetical protein
MAQMTDQFTQAYIECALWSSTDEDGDPLDGGWHDLAPETKKEMEQDCADFQEVNADLLTRWYELGEREERAGHDFWLTRNGNGAGFWDRFYGDQEGTKLGKMLTKAAKFYGSRDLYVGDDDLIYQA